MAYSGTGLRDHFTTWLAQGWIRGGENFMDFGAQEFASGADETRQAIGELLAAHGIDEGTARRALGSGMPQVSDVFRALGITYYSIDVDGAHGSAFFDLNSFAPPDYWHAAFDFVNNHGTIEHLINPINGFHVAHEMCKVGGIVRHSLPLFGWREHGFFYPTTKFYAHLCGDNRYEVLHRYVDMVGYSTWDDPFFPQVACKDQELRVADLWMELVYRKTHDGPFMLPIDHVTGDHAREARERLASHHRRLAAARLVSGQ